MEFFSSAAGLIGKLAVSLGTRSLGDKVKEIKISRKMARLVEDAVDRVVEQTEEYLRAENVSDTKKNILIISLCARLEPLLDEPQKFFAGDLNGALIFQQSHPNGELPREIIDEQLGQFYTVLFPQIAHFLAGSKIALTQWQAEGFREEFKRLTHLAEEIRTMNAKVADVPTGVVNALVAKDEQESEIILRKLAQTTLNNLLLRLDLSPLRSERTIHASLGDIFVIPEIEQRLRGAEPIGGASNIINAIAASTSRSIVYGGPGVGKTTCALWMQSTILQANTRRLAVIFRLREGTNIENLSLLELLRGQSSIHLRDAVTNQVIEQWYSAGRLVVILDGFDEVPEKRRDDVEKWIKNFAAIAENTSIIVTSRPLQSGHLENLSQTWKQWDLLPFDEQRIIEFIQRWHHCLPEGELSPSERNVDATALAKTFFDDPSLKTWSDTPLMLGTLFFEHHRDKKLPSGRADLYERYITAMLGLRDTGLGIEARATKLTDKQKRSVLARIALYFHLHNTDQVNDDTMQQLVDSTLKSLNYVEDVPKLLAALRERTGLLQGPGAWSFTHKTISEYLVADLICDGTLRMADERRLDRRELWSHRNEDLWTTVLFFGLAGRRHANSNSL